MSLLATKQRRDLWARKWQYGAAAMTIFMGVMVFALSYDAYINLDISYHGTYDRLAFADMTVTGADDGFAEQVARVPGVDLVAERTQADVPIRVDGKSIFIGRLVGMPVNEEPQINKLDMVDGEYLSASVDDQVVVEIHMAEYWGITPGDTVEYFDGVEWRKVDVGGTGISPEYIWPARSAQDAITTADSFGVLFVGESVTEDMPAEMVKEQTLVLYQADADTDGTDDRVEALARSAGAASAVTQIEQPSNKALSLDLLGFEQMAYAFPVMFLLAAGMATYTLLTRLVFREREIIGTLRANGMSRAKVVRHYLGYGLWIGLGAAVLGLAAGIPLGWYTTYMYTEELGIPDTIRELRWITPVVGLGFGLFTGLVSAWVPARQAASLDPAEAMRGDIPAGGGRRSLIERILPFSSHWQTRWLMVFRGIGRNKRRSLSTVLGVVLALVLILASWGLMDTMMILLTRQFTEIQLNDASVISSVEVDDDLVGEVADVDGVMTAERVYAAAVGAKGPDGLYETQLLGFDADTVMHDFGDVQLPVDDGAILGTSLRDQLGVEEGDRIDLSFTGLDTDAQVTVAGFVEEPLGTFVYMRDTALEDLLADADSAVSEQRLRQPDSAIVMARYADGVDRAKVTAAIENLDDVTATSDARILWETVDQYMGLFYVFIGLMLLFGGAMAFALIFNTMSVNLAERATELATMRANGLSRGKAAALVVGENMLLTIIGIPPGLLAGYWAADALMKTYSSDMFVFPLEIRPSTYVLSALAMIVVTLISLWPGIRAAEKADIGTIVRQRGV